MNNTNIDEMVTAIQQLREQGKEVIAIDPDYVLVLWHQDNSYVMWRWYMTMNGNVSTECGRYLQSTMYNQSEALDMYHNRKDA